MNRTFYITTSIPYVNGAPHLGNVLDSVYADALARYKRQQGYDVRFLTGTDEHGTKIQRSAEAAGLTPQEFVDKNSDRFKELKEVLNLSWDDFIRTSDRGRHWPGAQKLWEILKEKGWLRQAYYAGLYCIGHEAFITEKDLDKEGLCADHQKEPERIDEENWFFNLASLASEIRKKIESTDSDRLKIVPEFRKNEILSLLHELQDVSFSRPKKDLKWGVPVPSDDSQTMYVWAEALVNYISALGFGSEDDSNFKKYWLEGDEIVQVVGKDNLRFHAAIWPGMLLAAGLWPKNGITLFVHGFLTVDGKKISKTVGNVIDPKELVNKYGADAVRYYLLKEISPFEDGDFSYEKFEQVYNGDLANGLGNFAARVLTLGEKAGELKIGKSAKEKEINASIKKFEEKLSEFKFHEGVSSLWDLVKIGDAYVNETRPWETNDAAVLADLVLILEALTISLKPILPDATEKLSQSIPRAGSNICKVSKISNLFPRIQ